MLMLACTWMGKPIKVTNCHCPASKKRPWDPYAKDRVLPRLFELAGAVPYKEWSGDAGELVAWILGGDLNLLPNAISDKMQQY